MAVAVCVRVWLCVWQLTCWLALHRLEESLRRAAYSMRCTEQMRETTFVLPTQAVGRYVRCVIQRVNASAICARSYGFQWPDGVGVGDCVLRIQLEGTNYLHVAQVEVYGHWDEVTINKPVSKRAHPRPECCG